MKVIIMPNAKWNFKDDDAILFENYGDIANFFKINEWYKDSYSFHVNFSNDNITEIDFSFNAKNSKNGLTDAYYINASIIAVAYENLDGLKDYYYYNVHISRTNTSGANPNLLHVTGTLLPFFYDGIYKMFKNEQKKIFIERATIATYTYDATKNMYKHIDANTQLITNDNFSIDDNNFFVKSVDNEGMELTIYNTKNELIVKDTAEWQDVRDLLLKLNWHIVPYTPSDNTNNLLMNNITTGYGLALFIIMSEPYYADDNPINEIEINSTNPNNSTRFVLFQQTVSYKNFLVSKYKTSFMSNSQSIYPYMPPFQINKIIYDASKTLLTFETNTKLSYIGTPNNADEFVSILDIPQLPLQKSNITFNMTDKINNAKYFNIPNDDLPNVESDWKLANHYEYKKFTFQIKDQIILYDVFNANKLNWTFYISLYHLLDFENGGVMVKSTVNDTPRAEERGETSRNIFIPLNEKMPVVTTDYNDYLSRNSNAYNARKTSNTISNIGSVFSAIGGIASFKFGGGVSAVSSIVNAWNSQRQYNATIDDMKNNRTLKTGGNLGNLLGRLPYNKVKNYVYNLNENVKKHIFNYYYNNGYIINDYLNFYDIIFSLELFNYIKTDNILYILSDNLHNDIKQQINEKFTNGIKLWYWRNQTQKFDFYQYKDNKPFGILPVQNDEAEGDEKKNNY